MLGSAAYSIVTSLKKGGRKSLYLLDHTARFLSMKRTLVIGNGFDLDAGLKTSYGDFVRSSYWPFNHSSEVYGHDTLASYLRKKSQLNTWFDVETALYDYAKEGLGMTTVNGFNIGNQDKADFENLKSSLTAYLQNQEVIFQKVNRSVAIGVLYALLKCRDNFKIYTYNYTNLKNIAARFSITEKFAYEYMHGSTFGNDIILGIGDKDDINSHYFYFKKIAASNFASHSIIPDMIDSDEVIVFGHSLSSNDHPYFAPYIHYLLDYTNTRKSRRTLTIFTRNENDRLEIKKQIETLTENRVTLFYSLNQINIFCTDGSMTNNVETYLKSINKDWGL